VSRKVFTSQKISIFLFGEEMRVQTLVSTYGAKYVFDENDLPESARALLGSEIHVSYKGIPARSRFVRETNPAGTIYSLRFLNPSSLLTKQIEKDLDANGIPSPWKRGLPRLGTGAKHLPGPVLVVANFKSATFYMHVKNFTLGGLLLEYSGPDADDLGIGTRLEFDVVTNGGDKLSEITGAIAHITSEMHERGSGVGKYQFGIRFTDMTSNTENRYRTLIREHCQKLREESPP
jgi:hypothetical protein